MLCGQYRLIFLEQLAKSAADLGYFVAVLLSRVKDVCFASTDDLCYSGQALEG
jgi:hypothetical protein